MTFSPEASLEFWRNRWHTGPTSWHLKDLNPILVRHFSTLINGCGKEGYVFVPLCGKCVDMRWLYEQGYKIIGADCSEEAISTFYTEQNLPCQIIEDERIGKIFQTPDARLKIYCCDILKMTKEICGEMLVVWDRGSLIAMDKELRKSYVATLKALVHPDFRYLLDVLHYQDWYVSSPPRSIPPELVEDLFGEDFNIKLIEHRDISLTYAKRFSVKTVHNNIYLLTMKAKTN